MTSYDTWRRRRFLAENPALRTLILLNIGVFVFQHLFLALFRYQGTPLEGPFVQYFALQPLLSGHFFPWQLLTYQFMHAGLENIWHIVFNLFVLWMFGMELEQLWGSRRFVWYYLLCGIGAGVLHLLVQLFWTYPAPTVGASGAVYGVLLAFGLTFPDRPVFMFPFFIPIPARILVLLMAAIEFISGVSSAGSPIAHFAHLGGALTGFLLLRFGDRWGIFAVLDRLWFWARHRPYRRRTLTVTRSTTSTTSRPIVHTIVGEEVLLHYEGEPITQKHIDAILDKIAAHGYQSLTERERQILYEASRRLQAEP
ncbi:MAG: rhomboid family intramembrane serine protease [Candidatus Kapabacteria bacterium]|nr:rhomboid family intramembrane serine protease [Candidatus Kapabacteria bacterium]MCS7169285.1 rhomboid family intramembrane serine protease [Candidatus Kapabacteria bacterium]MDW7997092.1 rhomboid family intramembrane serine protease [Bacteroidota bacterium]MDW8225810.1 rhomboid family intramembrane serine protease [Bacteroidota bacterium]